MIGFLNIQLPANVMISNSYLQNFIDLDVIAFTKIWE